MPLSSAKKSFKDIQYQFTRHIRDPANAPAPEDIEDRRMAIYRDLLYHNVESFLANSFPVLRKVLKDHEWHSLIREYFKNHQSRTPLFPRMPQEFLQYLQDDKETAESLYPFLPELAHYEWVELALSIDTREIRQDRINLSGDLLSGIPVLNELSWSLVCQYPVHRVDSDYLPVEKPGRPTCLLVYRDRRDRVRFIELNPLAARLVDCLKQNAGKQTGREILMEIAGEIAHPNPGVVVKGGHTVLEDMREKQIVLGTEQAR